MVKESMQWLIVISSLGVCSAAAAEVAPLANEEAALSGSQSVGTSASSVPQDPYGTSLRAPEGFVGLTVGVPIMLNTDSELIRPGGDFNVQGGINFGYVGAFLHGGWRFIPVDFDRALDAGIDTYDRTGRDRLKNPYFGFGVRGQVPNRSRFVPYLSGAFDFNFWNFRESAVACGGYGYWWCGSYDVYRFTPGFTGRIGTTIALGRHTSIDAGLGMTMSFEGNFFESNQSWVEPYLGVVHRM
jgi:hypothetical protein